MKKLFVVLLSVMFLTGCGLFSNNDIDPCSDGFHLEDGICIEDLHPEGTFTSEDDILDLFVSFREKQQSIGMFRGWNMMMEDDVAMEMDGAEAPTNEEKGSDDYSETNNQVEGVDEMDNVLTDGKYIYIANYNKIQVILAYTQSAGPDALALVKEITFDELQGENEYFYFNGMYVDDDRLIVVGNSYEYFCNMTYEDKNDESGEDDVEPYYQECWWYEYHTSTLVFEYSMDDFELINEYELSGNFVGSRKIGDSLYFVTNEYVPFYYMDYEEYNFSLENFLPHYRVNEASVELDYSDILYIEGTEPTTFTTFYGLNLDTNEVSSEVVLGEGGYNLYVSIENIYLTATKWNFNDVILREIDEAVEDGDDDFVPEEDPYEITTSILRVAIHDGVVEFAANGDVPGIALDQFAMDEKDGYVRIVTTEQNWWWWGWNNDDENTINNQLLILDLDLNIVSSLTGIGKPGETVQSVRFVGDFAYVVTFFRTDPFYVLDVSDPLHPTKLSELEIPGFSDYLQPVGEDYILGIGYGDNDGGTQGLKISLYDVSDKSNAIVADELIYPYSDGSYIWTSTVYNHKDLLVSIDKGIIALPYTINEWGNEDNDWWWSYRTGVLVLNLDVENGTISERGRVEHSDTNSYDTYVYKSKFIDDYLYTISSKFVKVSTIADPETILNELLIGEPLDLDVPGEVEPVEIDPVDPEPDVTCTDGYTAIDGDCVLEETLFEGYQHVYSWDEATTLFPEDYLVYIYSDDCVFCEEVNDSLLDFLLVSDLEVIFLNLSDAHDEEDFPIDAYPALLLITDMALGEEYIGADEILTYIN